LLLSGVPALSAFSAFSAFSVFLCLLEAFRVLFTIPYLGRAKFESAVTTYPIRVMHRFHDGSVLRTISAKELIAIPVWKGNRILDTDHASTIQKKMANIRHLDSGYKIIKYMEADASGVTRLQSYLIDGQHRAHVLREHFLSTLCEADFTVVATEKSVSSESEAIEYFNVINNVKPQRWAHDPKILVNQYIMELERRFNPKAKKDFVIRQGATKRPYLSVDRLREVLLENVKSLGQDSAAIQEFGRRAVEKNAELLTGAPMLILANTKDSPFYERAAKEKFMLAVDIRLRWIKELSSL
jgi:hypothetical protein